MKGRPRPQKVDNPSHNGSPVSAATAAPCRCALAPSRVPHRLARAGLVSYLCCLLLPPAREAVRVRLSFGLSGSHVLPGPPPPAHVQMATRSGGGGGASGVGSTGATVLGAMQPLPFPSFPKPTLLASERDLHDVMDFRGRPLSASLSATASSAPASTSLPLSGSTSSSLSSPGPDQPLGGVSQPMGPNGRIGLSDDKTKRIHNMHGAIQTTIGQIQDKTQQILQDQERDLIRAFRARLAQVRGKPFSHCGFRAVSSLPSCSCSSCSPLPTHSLPPAATAVASVSPSLFRLSAAARCKRNWTASVARTSPARRSGSCGVRS